MFHTLFDYQDQNVPNNNQIPKNKYKKYEKKFKKSKKTYYSYYGKGNEAYEYYNKKDESDESNNSSEEEGNFTEKFENTKNKVNLTVYKNGFILDNGPFRDRSIPENEEFMEQVDRGVIPHELMDKGISSLGILLTNRRNEIYRPIMNQNHYSIYNYDFMNPYNNQYQCQNTSYTNQSFRPMPKKYNGNKIIPIGMNRVNSSNNLFRNIDSKLSLQKSKNKQMRNSSGEPKEKEKKFTAFSGEGKIIGKVNMAGLHVDKNLKNYVDIYQPVCNVSIRLFNGEVVKAQFNYSQTLRDIYLYVRRISGCIKFHLLDGFPPKLLRDYDRTIYELNIHNSLLTQKIY